MRGRMEFNTDFEYQYERRERRPVARGRERKTAVEIERARLEAAVDAAYDQDLPFTQAETMRALRAFDKLNPRRAVLGRWEAMTEQEKRSWGGFLDFSR